MIPRVFTHCWSIVYEDKEREFNIHASFLEIYNECIYDLLKKERVSLKLKVDKKKGVYVENLQKQKCSTLQDMKKVMQIGNKNRTVGATAMNEGSSRSHSIFTLYVEAAEKN